MEFCKFGWGWLPIKSSYIDLKYGLLGMCMMWVLFKREGGKCVSSYLPTMPPVSIFNLVLVDTKHWNNFWGANLLWLELLLWKTPFIDTADADLLNLMPLADYPTIVSTMLKPIFLQFIMLTAKCACTPLDMFLRRHGGLKWLWTE